jgi:hypothetical protein
VTKAKNFDFSKLKDDLRALAKTSDSSEQHNLIDFMVDVVDSVQYDIKAGNYKEAEVKHLLLTHMTGCLEQFEDHIAYLKKYLKERIK